MRGVERPETLFSYVSLEDRIPANHPIRKLRAVVDALLRQMDDRIDACYAKRGRPSIPPHRLLRALLLQAIYSIPSERRLVEAIEYNLLYRWFVGLGLDEPVWDHSTFSANRERLLNQEIVQAFFRQVRDYAELRAVLSHEHFSVDGTLIDAWALRKSLAPIDEETGPHQGQGKNPTVDFTGEKRSNATHRSTTDPDARLFRKSAGDKAHLCYAGHVLMENRNGLVVDAEVTLATGTAEYEAAEVMVERSVPANATLAADRKYDAARFLDVLRRKGITPHIACKKVGSNIPEALTQSEAYRTSLKVRKRIEEIFGWVKTVGGLRKARFVGLAKVKVQALIAFAAYNLVRLAKLSGWPLKTT